MWQPDRQKNIVNQSDGLLMINIYSANEISRISRNDISSSSILEECSQKNTSEFVSNVKTTMAAMAIENQVYPLTINKKEYQNALICSPYTTYVTYPLSELKKIKKRWIKSVILLNYAFMNLLCRLTKFNKVVQINNNLNSLLQHPAEFSEMLPTMTKKLIAHYPKHAITLFRVNELLDQSLLMALKKNDYSVFPDRSTHIYFPHNDFQKRTDTKNDFDLLKKSDYTVVSHAELLPTDAARFAELYRMLFIDKHSKLNPIYTETYFRKAILNHWHHYTALRNKKGQIDVFLSWIDNEKNMYCGPMGYDTSISQSVGLYRQAIAIYLDHAYKNQLIFNMGGGTNQFKLNRGSTLTLEYTAVYCDHLSFYRKIPWKVLTWIFNKYLVKIITHLN